MLRKISPYSDMAHYFISSLYTRIIFCLYFDTLYSNRRPKTGKYWVKTAYKDWELSNIYKKEKGQYPISDSLMNYH